MPAPSADGMQGAGTRIRIYAVNAADARSPELWDQLAPHCSDRRREQLARFVDSNDAWLSLLAETLLLAALASDWLPPRLAARPQLGRLASGKPRLEGALPRIHFNLSHSGDWCACAVSAYPVGIDVERIRMQELDGVDRYLNPEERDYLRTSDAAVRLRRFYEIWTMKESYVKAVGRGLSLGMDTFSVIGRSLSDLAPYRLKKFALDDLHPAAVCGWMCEMPDEWTVWTAERIAGTLRSAAFDKGG